MRLWFLAPLALALATSALAQAPVTFPTEFAPEARTPSASELAEALKNRKFVVTLPQGGGWRLDFKSREGYMFLNAANTRGAGRWRTQDGLLCVEYNEAHLPSGCDEVRLVQERLYLRRRSNGQIVELALAD